MTTRRQHIADVKESRARVWKYAASLKLRKASWRSWMHHPIANTTYWFWGWMPHKPRLRLTEMSVGSVSHERKDADYAFFVDECTRCGWEDEANVVEAWPSSNALIKEYFKTMNAIEDDSIYEDHELHEHGGEG